MAFKSLNDFVLALENAGELIRIQEFCDPILEIAEITDRVSKQAGGGKALLFENTGTAFPLLINSYGSTKRMNIALGTDSLEDISKRIYNVFHELKDRKTSWFEKLKAVPLLIKLAALSPAKCRKKAICQQVINRTPDLTTLPVLKCWPYDGGRFITLPMVITKHPETGERNVGMYRMQLFDKNTTGMHWHKHKTGAMHYEAYKKLGKKMPVVVAIGGDPALTYSATAPLPENVDEFLFAGFLRNERIRMVKCITQDLEVPADADFVIEGYIDPSEEPALEGPFGDHTGFYSLPDYYPIFHVTCITHQNKAVYPATIVGVPPQEDAYIAKATERIFLTPIKISMLPEMVDMNIPVEGTAHNLTIVKIKNQYQGHAEKVIHALWGAGQMMFNKILLLVDETIDIQNYNTLATQVFERFNPSEHILFSRGPLDILDHSSSKQAYGSKMGIIATDAPHQANEINTDEVRNALEALTDEINYDICLNDKLVSQQIPVITASVEKKQKNQVKDFAELFFAKNELAQIKLLIITDSFVDISDISTTIWITAANIDPLRDCFIIPSKTRSNRKHLAIDATIKTADIDGFNRDWPNVITSNRKTIDIVDLKWKKLGFETFMESPSIKFMNYQKGDKATIS